MHLFEPAKTLIVAVQSWHAARLPSSQDHNTCLHPVCLTLVFPESNMRPGHRPPAPSI